jgi:hypothetical protein
MNQLARTGTMHVLPSLVVHTRERALLGAVVLPKLAPDPAWFAVRARRLNLFVSCERLAF